MNVRFPALRFCPLTGLERNRNENDSRELERTREDLRTLEDLIKKIANESDA